MTDQETLLFKILENLFQAFIVICQVNNSTRSFVPVTDYLLHK